MRFRDSSLSLWALLCVLAPLLSCTLQARQPGIQFERISLEQGLSQTSVFAIAQDRLGFMWFGTQDGLNKYDGHSFTIYHRDALDSTSLSDNYVTALLVDKSGTLWAGTRGGGLNRFNNENGTFARIRHVAGDSTSLGDDQVTSLCEDPSGSIWVGTANGLNRLDPASGKCVQYSNDPTNSHSLSNNYVQSLYVDSRGTLWVGMIRNVATFNTKSNSFDRLRVPWSITLFDGFTEDQRGVLWAATTIGVLCFDNGGWSFAPGLPRISYSHTMLRDRNGAIWVGSNTGLTKADPANRSVATFVHEPANRQSLSGNAILSLFQDRTGIVWIGTYEGINKFAPMRTRFKRIGWDPEQPQSLGWNKVRAFCQDKTGMVWVASQEGLAQYDEASNSLNRVSDVQPYPKGAGTPLLWSLEADHASSGNAIWIGTNGGGLIHAQLHRSGNSTMLSYKAYTHRSGDPGSISGDVVLTMLQSRAGVLWIGTLLEGLDKFDARTGRFVAYRNRPSDPQSLSHDEIWSLCEDRTGTIWVGTAGGGLNKLDPENGKFTRYQNDPKNPKSLSDNKVTAIVPDESQVLWVGTYAGLNRFDPASQSFTHYTMKDGLPDDVIYSIVKDGTDNLWISTNKGLSRFSKRKNIFRNYDIGDGLQSNEFNHGAAFRAANGHMFFGGVNGFNVFNPDSLFDNPNIPGIVITDFRIFNKSVYPSPTEQRLKKTIAEANTVSLSYRDAVFSFEFAALEFTNPSKNQYAYMMEGFDNDWIYAGSKREATYTNLDPGSYVFRVKASNSDGVWNDRGTSLAISIAPPFWQAWWFRSLAILGFLSIGPYVYYRRVSALKQKQKMQEDLSRRLIESQEAERKRVAAELHDSIGQDLLVIKNKLLLGLQARKDGQDEAADFDEAIDYVSKSLKHVREISRNLRPIQLDQIGLTAAIESLIETVAESSNLRSTIAIDKVDNILSKEGEINLFRIIQESLNNVLKHSKATTINIQMKKADRFLRLSIEDDGRGMPPGNGQGRGLGLSSMNERARILGGEFSVDSNHGKGTRVHLTIPLPGTNNA
ncbi:MAG TPA: two-component regulator propeller domain-containing protein [Bacteroidota bacterium]